MFRSHRLKPLTAHDGELAFEWDPDTGQVRGPGAPRVRDLAADAIKAGGVVGDPYPTHHAVLDPLHEPSEMAVVLGQFWALDEGLAAAYPQNQPADGLVEIGADGGERPADIQLLH